MAPCDRSDRLAIGWRRAFDRERLGAAGEERLAQHRILDQVQHVSRVAPQLRRRSMTDLGTQLPPGRPTKVSVAHWIRCLQRTVDGALHCLMHDETVGARLDEGQGSQTTQKLVGIRVRQHGPEQRSRAATHDGRRLERLARLRVRHIGEEDLRELLEQPVAGHLADRQVRACGKGRRPEAQGQRMTVRHGVQRDGLVTLEAERRQEGERRIGLQRAERDGANGPCQLRCGEPGCLGRLAARDDEPMSFSQVGGPAPAGAMCP